MRPILLALSLLFLLSLTTNAYTTEEHYKDTFDEIDASDRINIVDKAHMQSLSQEEMVEKYGFGDESLVYDEPMSRDEAETRLIRFYNSFGPHEHVDRIPKILDDWEGRYEDMVNRLYRKHEKRIEAYFSR